jgi:hypothetical protein
MNSGRCLPLCILALVLAWGAGQVDGADPTTGAKSPRKPASGFDQIGYRLGRGLSDRHDEIVIFADGHYETPAMEEISGIHRDKGKRDKMTVVAIPRYVQQEDLDKLNELVKPVNWRSLLPEYAAATPLADGFSEQITAVVNGAKHETLITDPDARLPAELPPLAAFLKQLQESYVWHAQPDKTAPGDFTRIRWLRTTRGAKSEDCTCLEIDKQHSFDAWQRHKGTVWGLWSEDKLLNSSHGTLGDEEFQQLRQLVVGIDWDKVGDGRDARSETDLVSQSVWLDVGKRTYFFMCQATKTPVAFQALFGQLESIEKAHREGAK